MHWSYKTKNPISETAKDFVRNELRSKFLGCVSDLDEFWTKILKNTDLLDIGVVEHDISFTKSDSWKHKKFAQLARRIVGIDILKTEVTALQQSGYDVRLCDATSDHDLGERFDTIYVGDVIEHVDNPRGLIQFCARHLNAGGSAYITTPCPFWWRHIVSTIRDGTFIGNVDHVRWITPVNALELSHRAGVQFDGYWRLNTIGSNRIKRLVLNLLPRAVSGGELLSWGYVYKFSLLPSSVHDANAHPLRA